MTREEAIRRIKAWNLDSDDMEVLAVIIPELAESEDEKIRQFLLRLVKRCPENSIDFMGEIKKGDVIAWLEKQKEQKWGEDDEKMLARIIERGQSQIQMFETGLLPEHISWLKSLRPSFKDKEMKLKILKYLSTRCSSLEFEEVEDYLNNLRPSWEPSKEQMDALERCIDYLDESDNDDFRIMLTLYEQLVSL